MEEYIQVLTTTEKREDAEKIAKMLLEKRLAGCIALLTVNLFIFLFDRSIKGKPVNTIMEIKKCHQ
jgi:uncharacterized protein involved in tolerance to divalent cations